MSKLNCTSGSVYFRVFTALGTDTKIKLPKAEKAYIQLLSDWKAAKRAKTTNNLVYRWANVVINKVQGSGLTVLVKNIGQLDRHYGDPTKVSTYL